MITLTGFAQATSQLVSESGLENPPVTGNAEDAGINNLAAFDAALLQAREPHQPISLRPSVVMDLMAQVDDAGKNSATAPEIDEQNQQLLNVLLQTQAQHTPAASLLPMTALPRSLPQDEGNSTAELMPPVPQKESSALVNLLKSVGARLDITPPAASVGENALSGRIVPEGLNPVIPSAAQAPANGNGANNPHEATTPRMESQLTLAKSQPEWSQQLRTVLGERLQLQLESKMQHATIRLDPPDMGKIDISVHMEGGKLQVHINASQGDVYRALQQSSAELRQTLTGQNSAAVEVQISANSQQQQRQQQHQKPHDAILAARHIETQVDMGADDGTLLITV
ncbi:flagellar hook-length control protein FliK [Yersinia alsatica]|uniref:flagellar hook-length control protein FliK n=1 Tax=Yersinia alsatica TaxID=2890317 RepID=UPI0011A8C3AF|nr:flagellar hook-length control protein FliK [Yersinia alsatica]